MQINIIKKHSQYPLGIADVDEKRAEYLIRMGVAESIEKDKSHLVKGEMKVTPEMLVDFKDNDLQEKREVKPKKEKAENKTGNVPTAKKRK